MDTHEYVLEWLVRQRLAEMRDRMAAGRASETAVGAPGRLRASLGTGLIRLGAWLLRDGYAAHHVST
jgi:hypothetical protein